MPTLRRIMGAPGAPGHKGVTVTDRRLPTVTEASAYHLGRQQGAIDCLEALDELHRFIAAGASLTGSLTDDGAAILVTLRARLVKVRNEATADKASTDRAIAGRPA